MSDQPNKPENAPTPAESPQERVPEITSAALLAGHREVLIRHGDEVYRLRLTRNGKLILQK